MQTITIQVGTKQPLSLYINPSGAKVLSPTGATTRPDLFGIGLGADNTTLYLSGVAVGSGLAVSSGIKANPDGSPSQTVLIEFINVTVTLEIPPDTLLSTFGPASKI